jgi:hypothetical protein
VTENTYVLFVDMMGFAALVESEPDFELTPAMSRALGPDYNPNVRFANAEENIAPTPLARTIGTFYRSVIGNEQFTRATTSVFFSDCAFIVFPTLENVFFAAQGLLNSLLLFHRIPFASGLHMARSSTPGIVQLEHRCTPSRQRSFSARASIELTAQNEPKRAASERLFTRALTSPLLQIAS